MIAGKDSSREGEAKNSWLTGTASWNFVALSQWILGIRPDYDGLCIDPCLPESLKGITVKRIFQNSEYLIEIKNPEGINKGIKSAYIDGRLLEINKKGYVIIKKDNSSTSHSVEIIMGI